MPDLDRLLRRWDRLRADRAPYEADWRLLGEFLLPRKRFFADDVSASRKVSSRLFDTSGIESAIVLAASLGGMLTNPAQAWFSLVVRETDLAKDVQTRGFLEDVGGSTYLALSQSNFTTEIGETYLPLSVFATGAILTEQRMPSLPGRFSGLRFTSIPIGEYTIGEDADGCVDTLYRQVRMSARACAAPTTAS